jgi:hypothetical protein
LRRIKKHFRRDRALTSLISELSDDEQIDLVALMWLGRNGYGADGWDEVRG